jgi:hypothetical protein
MGQTTLGREGKGREGDAILIIKKEQRKLGG